MVCRCGPSTTTNLATSFVNDVIIDGGVVVCLFLCIFVVVLVIASVVEDWIGDEEDAQ